MAKKQTVTYSYICDVCGTEIADRTENAERRLSFEGRDYEIDLCEKDRRGLEKVLEGLGTYVAVGRRLGGGARGRRAGAATPRPDTRTLREWARANGWPNLGERGRIPVEARHAWEKAGSPA